MQPLDGFLPDDLTIDGVHLSPAGTVAGYALCPLPVLSSVNALTQFRRIATRYEKTARAFALHAERTDFFRTAHPAWRAAGEIIPTRSYRIESLGALVMENKYSTKPYLRQDFSKPPHGRNQRAPTERRRGAGKPQTSAEAVADLHSRSGKQGVWFRGAGNFLTSRMREGSFCAAPSARSIEFDAARLRTLAAVEDGMVLSFARSADRARGETRPSKPFCRRRGSLGGSVALAPCYHSSRNNRESASRMGRSAQAP